MGVSKYQSAPPGTIRLRVAEVAYARGYVNTEGPFAGTVNLTALQRGTDLAYTTLTALVRQPATVRAITFDTLARLCAFLDCQPGDLLVYEPRDGAYRPPPRLADPAAPPPVLPGDVHAAW